MSYATAYKAAAAAAQTVPDDWPDGWTFPPPPYPPGFSSADFLVIDGIGAVDETDTATHYSGGNPFRQNSGYNGGAYNRRVDLWHFPSAIDVDTILPGSLYVHFLSNGEIKATPDDDQSGKSVTFGMGYCLVLEDFDPDTVTHDDLTLGTPASGIAEGSSLQLQVNGTEWENGVAVSQAYEDWVRTDWLQRTSDPCYGLAVILTSPAWSVSPPVPDFYSELVYDAATMPVIYIDP